MLKEVASRNIDWSKSTVLKLREELRSRELKVSGRKAELVARLEAHDERSDYRPNDIGTDHCPGANRNINREMKELSQVGVLGPALIWNVICFCGWALGLYFQILWRHEGGSWLGFWLQVFFGYMSFTGVHDAAHNAASSSPVLNWLCGFFSTGIMLFPGSWDFWRKFHIEHHRYTNDNLMDPDFFASTGRLRSSNTSLYIPAFIRGYQLALMTYPSREITLIVKGERPFLEILIFVFHLGVVIGSFVGSCWIGVQYYWWWWFMLPGSLAVAVLTYLFSVVPHYDRHDTPQQNKLKATYNVRHPFGPNQYLDSVFSVLFQFQNYHGTHHFFPSVPAWRYHKLDELVRAKHGDDCMDYTYFPSSLYKMLTYW